MKIWSCLLLFLSSTFYFAQDLPQSDTQVEIFCITENTTGFTNFSLTPISTVWDVDWPNIGVKNFEIDSDGSSGGGVYSAQPNDSKPGGFNYIASSESFGIDFPDFGFGIYKLSAEGRYIYLDWRDVNYGSYTYATGHSADIFVKYDGATNSLFIKNNSEYAWNSISNDGQYFSIWDLKVKEIHLH